MGAGGGACVQVDKQIPVDLPGRPGPGQAQPLVGMRRAGGRVPGGVELLLILQGSRIRGPTGNAPVDADQTATAVHPAAAQLSRLQNGVVRGQRAVHDHRAAMLRDRVSEDVAAAQLQVDPLPFLARELGAQRFVGSHGCHLFRDGDAIAPAPDRAISCQAAPVARGRPGQDERRRACDAARRVGVTWTHGDAIGCDGEVHGLRRHNVHRDRLCDLCGVPAYVQRPHRDVVGRAIRQRPLVQNPLSVPCPSGERRFRIALQRGGLPVEAWRSPFHADHAGCVREPASKAEGRLVVVGAGEHRGRHLDARRLGVHRDGHEVADRGAVPVVDAGLQEMHAVAARRPVEGPDHG